MTSSTSWLIITPLKPVLKLFVECSKLAIRIYVWGKCKINVYSIIQYAFIFMSLIKCEAILLYTSYIYGHSPPSGGWRQEGHPAVKALPNQYADFHCEFRCGNPKLGKKP